jgi:hypothetical protein
MQRLTLCGECKAEEGVRQQLTQLQQLTYLSFPGMYTLESGPGPLFGDESSDEVGHKHNHDSGSDESICLLAYLLCLGFGHTSPWQSSEVKTCHTSWSAPCFMIHANEASLFQTLSCKTCFTDVLHVWL